MRRRPLRLRSPFREILLDTRGSAPNADRPDVGDPASGPSLLLDLDRWFAEPISRLALLDLVGLGGRTQTEALLRRAREKVEERLKSGDVVAFETPIRRIIRPVSGAPAVLGPESGPVAQDDYLRVLLYDSVGELVPSGLEKLSVTVDVGLPSGPTTLTIAGGKGDIPSIPPGGPSACSLVFHGIADAADSLPAEAAPKKEAIVEASVAKGPIIGPTRVTRADLATAQQGVLDATNVFQLWRVESQVVELEHFHDDSAVFLPGLAPQGGLRDDADRVLGLDAIRACLRRAQGISIANVVIAGHHATLSEARAKCVRALLVADRQAWIDVATASSGASDVNDLLVWVAESRQWDCDPRLPDIHPPALQRFKRHYNELYGHALADDTKVDAKTWGAFFDLYMWTLRPSTEPRGLPYLIVPGDKQTYPVKLAEVSVNDARRWPELNAINPGKAMPGLQGWYPIQVGDTIYLPRDWNLDKLDAAGWTTVRSPSGDVPPDDPALAALAAPGPTVTGCADRHATHPHADAPERRGTERRVEVLFSPAPTHACEASGACAANTCQLYDPRAVDFDYVVDFVPGLAEVTIAVTDDSGKALARALVTLLGPTTRHARAADDGVVKIGDVIAGSYTVYATSPGYTIGQGSLPVTVPDLGAGAGGPRLAFAIPAGGGETGGNGVGNGPNKITVPLSQLQLELTILGTDFRNATPCDVGRRLEGAQISLDVSGTTDKKGKLVVQPPSTGIIHVQVSKTGPPAWDDFDTATFDVNIDPTVAVTKKTLFLKLTEKKTQTLRYWIGELAKQELAAWNAAGTNQAAWDRLNMYYTAVRFQNGTYWTDQNGPIVYSNKPNQWCGIFATWCVRQAARPCVHWRDGIGPQHHGPTGATPTPAYRSDVANVAIGDIVHYYDVWGETYRVAIQNKKPDAEARQEAHDAAVAYGAANANGRLDHHAVVIDLRPSDDGSPDWLWVTTIEGNTAEPTSADLAVRQKTQKLFTKGRAFNKTDRAIDAFYRSVPD